jgi:SNF2 family DNA or RNA helicase
MVESFAHDEVPVFCISLKAGGTGLNLTAADVVIHFDPWWNSAVQNQATDRAHRIGQKNVVNVYRILAKGTIEEKIVELQERKLQLSDRILGGESLQAQGLTREELLELLR